MKRLLLTFGIFVLLFSIGCPQPNSHTTMEYGIVHPVTGKTYLKFAEIKTDTSSSRLQNNIDYITVNDLQITLTNVHTVADTLFGDYVVNDQTNKRYIKAGLVQKDNVTGKYSGMVVTFWYPLGQLESMQAGFFIRKVNR